MRRCGCWKTTRAFELGFERVSSRLTAANSSKKRKWTPASNECSGRDADPLDARRRGRPGTHSPQLAQSTVLELYETIRSLKTSPRRGRLGREEGTRELVLSRLPYIVAYRIKEQVIEVLHIF